MKQYLELLENILQNGVEKESGRPNMPNTIGISHSVIKMDLQKGFPLLTTKKMHWKGIVGELLWFLRGETNIKYLVDNKINIWNADAYRWYLKYCNENDIEVYFDTDKEFVDFIKSITSIFYDSMNSLQYEYEFGIKKGDLSSHLRKLSDLNYIVGDLGKVYGYQWRNQNGVDQIADIVEGLKTNPYSRYHILDGWDKADFPLMALPPCHLLYQFIVRPLSVEERWDLFQYVEWNEPFTQISTDDDELNRICDEHNIPKFYLDLNMYQRSVDTFLGLSYNLASMSLLLMIMAKTTNMIEGVATWIGGDTHLYLPHIPMVQEQLKREPYELPEMKINKELNSLEDILDLNINDFELINYKSHPAIKAELFVGLKKEKK